MSGIRWLIAQKIKKDSGRAGMTEIDCLVAGFIRGVLVHMLKLEKASINNYLRGIWEGISWRWQRLLNLSILTKLSVYLGLSHQLHICRQFGIRFIIFRRQIRKTEWYTKKEIRDYQKKYLKKILLHAYENVPYYKMTFDAHGVDPETISGIDQLDRIPIIYKDTVRANTTNFCAKNFALFRPVKHRTSGSSGKPLEVYVDRKVDAFGHGLVWRHFNWGGHAFNKRMVQITRPFGYLENKINTKDLWNHNSFTNTLSINTALLSRHMEAVCRKVAEFSPEYIKSYPSILYALASYLEKYRTVKINPKAIFLWAEPIYPEQKKFIEQVFGCRVYEFYGMWEYLMFAYTCSHGNLHTSPELGILEIVKNGQKCKKGETGEIVCTTLHNHSMPLIRYSMEDYGYIEDKECLCGRQSEILNISGCRQESLIATKDGFAVILSGTPWFNQRSRVKIKQIQFYQEKKGEVVVRLVPEEDFSSRDLDNLKESINNYLTGSVDLSFEIVDEIPRTMGGKYKYIDSKVPIEI
ncbi:MAG: phenylacetate--CoA ligase family protein [Nitrospirae bacterium]|nr:phenylacetate--CoA ligase family protein [Nitrospirota bacterium]